MLFAFLLTVLFSARFGELDEFGRDLYGVALIGTTVAMILFLTPASYHRIAPRQQRDQRIKIALWFAMPWARHQRFEKADAQHGR